MKKGIDISKHNGIIDFNKVKAAGYDFVIIRAGYGISTVDSNFVKNITGAIDAGLRVGIYWFIYALSTNQAIQNAQKCIQAIAPYKDKISMKIWCDFEGDSDVYAGKKNVYFSKIARTTIVIEFLNTLEKAGYDVGLYANPDYIRNKFEYSRLQKYPLWLAQYASKKSYDCLIWQYSSKGNVPGISGNVDMNYLYDSSTVTVSNTSYFPQYKGTTVSITAALNSLGINSTYAYRKTIAAKNNIANYSGTAAQNTTMLVLLKKGKLIRP